MRDSRVITAEHLVGDRFALWVRHHKVLVDQPVEDGGTDSGPTPTELFVASIAGCVGHYARRYLARHHLPEDGLRVQATYEMSTDRPARVTAVELRIHVPGNLPAERLPALLAVASRCTLHNTLDQPPRIDIGLALPEHATVPSS
jgi:putative redox protein